MTKERAQEAVVTHTRLLRLALGVRESRDYWERFSAVQPQLPIAERAAAAFEQRWFGAKSSERVRYLLSAFAERYDAYPNALAVLGGWFNMDLATRTVLCHWHLQLSDPLYRRFTGDFLVQRRRLYESKVDRYVALRWVKTEFPDRWSDATCVQFASKLLSASADAGLLSKRDPRSLTLPQVPDGALAYLLYLLRETRIEGSITDNPYLASVGLDPELLAQRAKSLPGVTMRRMMGLVEFEWAHADLLDFSKEVAR